MKVKKRIGLLLFCLAIMGMFSVSVIPVQAEARVGCKHPQYMTSYNAVHITYNTPEGHFNEEGTKHVCATCGFTHWTDLHMVKTGEHDWYLVNEGKDTNGNIVWRYHCRGCLSYKIP
ncbi:MAG: hypothetical protein HFH83_12140 [Lachnospiraceae bacterium]|jgi:hypothetical protein|nr:hypothetical protein [Lachnospiraceae bacterium]